MRLLATTLVLLSLLSSCGSDKEDMCLFPLKGAENVNPDTRLVLTFNEVPVVGDSGMIRVFDAVSGEQKCDKEVDTAVSELGSGVKPANSIV